MKRRHNYLCNYPDARQDSTFAFAKFRAAVFERAGGYCEGETPEGDRCHEVHGLSLHRIDCDGLVELDGSEHIRSVVLLCGTCHLDAHEADDPVRHFHEAIEKSD